MKLILIILSAGLLFACTDKKKQTNEEMSNPKEEVATVQTVDYAQFGEKIEAEDALSAQEMQEKFKNLQTGDTLNVKFAANVEKVCQKKGCWMSLDLGDSIQPFVRFKDYGFFVPLNAAERKTVVKGKAFIRETSVNELRHYAEDAGKSQEEIEAIIEPKREYAFVADGVLMEK